MVSVNAPVADEVKPAFNAAAKGQNKGAVIADLMREAVERARRRQRHRQAAARILAAAPRLRWPRRPSSSPRARPDVSETLPDRTR